MIFLTKKHLSRRLLLRGAGAALALPLLDSMLPAAVAQSAAPRSRLACIYISHGAVMNRWMPQSDGRDFDFTPTLRSLEPFRERLNIVSDMTLPFAYGTDASAGANHARSSATWLTCAAPGTGPSPTSLDQVAAQFIGQDTPLPSLELSLDDSSSISYRTPSTPLPMEQNPQIVFERLFGDGSTAQERATRTAFKASLLDSVAGEVATLRRNLPGADKIRLERYLEDVREIERRLQLVAASATDDLDVPAKPVGVPASFVEHSKLMSDLLALAWQAEITRVSTLMVAREINNRVYNESGINEPFHNLSHHSEVQANKDKLAQLNEFHTRNTIAYLLQKLADTPDGPGSLLDHSVVLYGSGMSNSNQHDHDPLPILVAGGASGRLQGGRHIRAGVGTPLSNLHLALLEKLEVPVESFGDSTGLVTI
ncbi:MAG: DUF1552 domain-containing protein [Pseudomonadales bacterium]|jgi:hypothetical protein|nr:DUF1552 domain-containing protein [Pseudomonadales bacterium]